MSLRRHDIATGEEAAVYEPKWDVPGGYFSKGGKYLIVYLNEDSRGRAVVLDGKTYAPIPLTGMPEGLVNGVSIAPVDVDRDGWDGRARSGRETPAQKDQDQRPPPPRDPPFRSSSA